MRRRTVLAGLVFGACACSGATAGEHGAAAPDVPTATAAKEAGAGATSRPAFPEDAKREVIRMAKESGRLPVRGEFSLVECDGGYGPELIWQAEKTGEICTPEEAGAALTRGVPPPGPGGGTPLGGDPAACRVPVAQLASADGELRCERYFQYSKWQDGEWLTMTGVDAGQEPFVRQ